MTNFMCFRCGTPRQSEWMIEAASADILPGCPVCRSGAVRPWGDGYLHALETFVSRAMEAGRRVTQSGGYPDPTDGGWTELALLTAIECGFPPDADVFNEYFELAWQAAEEVVSQEDAVCGTCRSTVAEEHATAAFRCETCGGNDLTFHAAI